MRSTQKTFAMILGLVLLLVGILGFFANPIVGETGIFTTNTTHNVLHLLAGLIGLYVGTKGKGPGYNGTIGWIGVVLGILGFIPALTAMLDQYLMINTAITVLHLVIGIVALLVYYTAEK